MIRPMSWKNGSQDTPPVALFAFERLDHLHDVGGQVEVGDLHARRDAGGAGGVLQVGDAVVVDLDRLPRGADLVGHGVDGDHARTLVGRPAAEELAHTLGGVGGRQDRRRVAVVEHRVQPADVTGLVRVEQRDRDAAGVQGAEEGDEVVEVLRAQDRHPVPGLGDLLQPGADSAVAGAEDRPAQVALDAVAFGREVQEAVGQLVATHLRPPFDVADQAPVVGKPDLTVLEERVVEGHFTLLSWARPAARPQTPGILPG